MKNVQPFASCTLLICLAITAGCAQPGEPQEERHDTGRFGSPYQIVTNKTPTAPDEPPAIMSDSLSVMVSYAGGCEDHDFDLASHVTGDSAEVWLRHDNRGDACEAQISERLQFKLPERVLDARRIHLVNPEADVPFVLRWDVRPGAQAGPAADTSATPQVDTLN